MIGTKRKANVSVNKQIRKNVKNKKRNKKSLNKVKKCKTKIT